MQQRQLESPLVHDGGGRCLMSAVIIPAERTGRYPSPIAAFFTRTATNKNRPRSPTAPRSHDITINLLNEETRDLEFHEQPSGTASATLKVRRGADETKETQ